MDEAAIDILLANTRTNVSYLADYYSHFMNEDFLLDDGSAQYISFVGLPREQDKEPFFTPNAQDVEDLVEKKIWINDLWFHGSYVDYSALSKDLKVVKVRDDVMDCVVEAIRDRGLETGNIGIEMFRIPAGIFLKLKERLPQANFLDGTRVLGKIRMIKSEEEISRMKEAARISDAAIGNLFKNLKTGISELECEKIVKTSIARMGGDFVWDHIAFGPRSISLPTGRRLKKNGTVRIDLGAGFSGYVCDFCRTKVFGRPGKEALNIYNAVLKTLESVKENTGPEIKCSYLYNLAKAKMEEHGYSIFLPYAGHGVGKDLHELPYLTQFNDEKLEPGMVVTIEIYYVTNDYSIAINLEDQILVTDKGFRDFNLLSKDFSI